MAGPRVAAEPAGGALASPVERGHVPAAVGPMRQRFQILLDEVAAPRQEQERAPRRWARRPIKAPQAMAVWGRPDVLRHSIRQRAAGRWRGLDRRRWLV